MRAKTPVNIVAAMYGCFLSGVVLLAIAVLLFVPDYARVVTDRAVDRAVQNRTQSTMLDFARALDADWRELRHLSGRVTDLSEAEARASLDAMVGSGNRVSWAGYAGLDGNVIVASGGLLEGVDVSSRPWFAAGLRGGFAGDVHDALLLNRLLGGDEDNPIRFIDLALPVEDEGGRVIGVLSFHISFSWAESFLTEAAEIREMDILLVNSFGTTVFSTDPDSGRIESLQISRAAASGVATHTREVWPDGSLYFASVVPTITYADLPNFGWRLIGRVPVDAFNSDRQDIMDTLAVLLVCAALIFGGAAALFSLVFLRPIINLVQIATKIADGEDVYPTETRSSAEAAALSSALAALQSRVVRDKDSKFSGAP